MVLVSLGSQVSLDLEVRQWAQTSQDPLEIPACPVWMESMVPVGLLDSQALPGPVRPRETEVMLGCQASRAPLLGRENREVQVAPVITVARGSREREARPATAGVPG